MRSPESPRRSEEIPDITQPDVLAGLLKAGRIPFLRDVTMSGWRDEPDTVFREAWIPPVGTSVEQARWDSDSFLDGGKMVYDTPTGVKPAKRVMLDDDVVQRVHAQIEEALQS